LGDAKSLEGVDYRGDFRSVRRIGQMVVTEVEVEAEIVEKMEEVIMISVTAS
jgi:hypothetical protein